MFPVGELPKPEVRRIANEAGLPNHDRKDSTGICFIGERDFKAFLAKYLPGKKGEIRSVEGERKGEHDGVIYYTIGQRQGLGIGGAGEPWYVAGKDLERNILYVAQGDDHPALYSRGLIARDLHWIGPTPANGARFGAKTRYRQADQSCALSFRDDGSLHVEFDALQRAITPGQWVVFYDGEECVGGGVIHEAVPAALRARQPAA
jgi:tRNA-specific 2-thiouridylase